MNDRDIEYIMDETDNENLSKCCEAPIIAEGFCSDCKEQI